MGIYKTDEDGNDVHVCVEGFSNSASDSSEYKIGTTYVDELSQNTEKEYNDTIDTANKINTNIEYSGNLSNDDDVDYFTFNLTSAKTINVKLKQDADEISDKAYFVEVYNAAKNGQYRLCNSFYTKANVMSQGGKIQVPAGKYIVKVSTTKTANDKEYYRLLVEETNASNYLNVNTEPNDVEGTHILLDATICNIEKKGSKYTFAINRSFVGKKTKRTKATSVTFRKLKKKKNYYFKVRSYRISGGKTVYSSWSNVKKVKVKK